jgi:hypothetical protein
MTNPIELAGQVWCQSDTSHIVMDEVLCAAFADTLRDYGRAEYQRGRDECMAEWADHMKRINSALAKGKT